MDKTITYKQLKRARRIGIPLKLLLILCIPIALFLDAVLIFELSVVPGFHIRSFFLPLATNVPTIALAWLVVRRDKRIFARIQKLTYAEFSKLLRENRVAGDLRAKGLLDPLDRKASDCYVLDDGCLVEVAGTVNPRRDHDTYRYFQNVEIYKI
ncbi:hypothetical protein SADO_13478 [Salinisphaera dokdonensis CL-ES53]|uniref:Uncharacterized protein n=1 Tax=Salinisphaera dokdonensis CL-ES53 TaxID=1304272 RepID=A0ABV2B315_9GAMM